jgi:hypothetical protein
MISKQLSNLSVLSNCFLYEGKVYERLFKDADDRARLRKKYPKYGFKHKYRFFMSSDDYDYVTDKKLVRKLNKFMQDESKWLKTYVKWLQHG